MQIVDTTSEPKVGHKMRIEDLLYGPVGTITKIQKLQYKDNKCIAIPQMEEWPRGYTPDTEGCHLAISAYYEENTNIHFLCWIKFEEHNIDELLQTLYNFDTSSKNELMQLIYSLGNIGPNFQWWEEFCSKLDATKIQINPFYCLMVTMKPYRKHVSSFNDMVDRITAQMIATKEPLPEDSFSKWKINYEPK